MAGAFLDGCMGLWLLPGHLADVLDLFDLPGEILDDFLNIFEF